MNIGYFNAVTWESFIDSGNSGPVIMGFFYFFELLFNLAVIIFSVFLIVLLFKKRSTFPHLYIGFRIVVLVGLIIDYLLKVRLSCTSNWEMPSWVLLYGYLIS